MCIICLEQFSDQLEIHLLEGNMTNMQDTRDCPVPSKFDEYPSVCGSACGPVVWR
jgi:hypothetical protein